MQPSSHSGRVPVLTYHSQNIFGNDYATNDRLALASDVQAISQAGMRVISLSDFVDWLIGNLPETAVENSVVLTSDDAPIFDYEDVEYRDFGLQISTRTILRNTPAHITLFAIASPQAREEIGRDALDDGTYMTSRWWREADQSPWAAIENHGWDHCHPAVSNPVGGTGTFFGVSDYESCDGQVNKAADQIAAVTGRRPNLFAYPYGEASDYLMSSYLPEHENEHGMRAAVSTNPEYACRASSRWDIPRFIFGRDWSSPAALQAILEKAKRSW
jgi:hypothetical protein